jgi:hypothetical protein
MIESWDALKQQGSSHYKTGGVEPIDLYLAGGMMQDVGCGAIIKYAFRNRREANPDPGKFQQDMDKIIDYAQKLKAAHNGKE